MWRTEVPEWQLDQKTTTLGSKVRKRNCYLLGLCALPVLLWEFRTMRKAQALQSDHPASHSTSCAHWHISGKLEETVALFSRKGVRAELSSCGMELSWGKNTTLRNQRLARAGAQQSQSLLGNTMALGPHQMVSTSSCWVLEPLLFLFFKASLFYQASWHGWLLLCLYTGHLLLFPVL